MIKLSKSNEQVTLKKYERKIKSQFIIYADLESNSVPEDIKSKIQMSLIQTSIKNILLVTMVIN